MSKSSEVTRHAAGCIAVADDDPIVRDMVAACLEADGHAVHAFPNGAALVDALSKQTFDLFIIDLMMPTMDGFDVLARLRNDPEHRRSPRMIISSRNDTDALLQADAMGVAGYLIKPIDWQVVHFQVRGLLRLARAEQEASSLRYQAESRFKFQQSLNVGQSGRSSSHRQMFGLNGFGR